MGPKVALRLTGHPLSLPWLRLDWGTRTRLWPCRPSAPFAATASVSTAMPPVSTKASRAGVGEA